MHRLKYVLIQLAILFFFIPAMGEDLELNAGSFTGYVILKSTWEVHLKGTELKIKQRWNRKSKVKQIKPKEIEALRRALDQNGFSSLRSIYGIPIEDGGCCSLEVTSGMWKNSVIVTPFHGSDGPTQEEAADIRRFMQVWKTLKRIAGLSNAKDMCPNTDSLFK